MADKRHPWEIERDKIFSILTRVAWDKPADVAMFVRALYAPNGPRRIAAEWNRRMLEEGREFDRAAFRRGLASIRRMAANPDSLFTVILIRAPYLEAIMEMGGNDEHHTSV
jgi:hypothetical protein